MARFSFGVLGLFARAALAAATASLVAACGSGAVGAPPPTGDATKVTVLPATAVVYSGMPTNFVISGGNGSYVVTSSDQSVVPLAGAISGNTLTVVANNVGAETPVTLTVRDTGTATPASASLAVRPGTVSNEITITPSASQGLSCAPAICSGGDAVVTAKLSQAGAPLVGRSVRLDALSGDFRFVTSPAGSTIETLDTSVTLATDASGQVTARVRALPTAANQTALLQVTDVSSGAFQRASFTIAQATGTSPGFFATPSSIQFQGRVLGQCASTDITATFYVFGGTPPYTVANSLSTLIVRPDVITSSGGSFNVTPTGACIGVPGVPITIRDAAGRTTSVNVANTQGTTALPTLTASPTTVNISSCTATASVQVAGGNGGPYFVASGSDALIATISGNTVTISRRNPGGAAAASGSIGISDGTSVVTVNVALSGAALGSCPAAVFAASPAAVTLTDCTTSAQVVLSGGTGTYSAVANSGAIKTSVSGSVVSISRVVPSGTFGGGTVTVSDGQTTQSITVNASGSGAGACGNSANNLVLNPTAVTLTDCTTTSFVSITGGTGTYSATPSNDRLTVNITGSTLSVRRAKPSAAFSGGTVTVTDGSSSATLTVNATGEGAGTCPTPITASPSTVTLTDCTTAAIVTVSGGNGNGFYSATPNSNAITVTQNSSGGNVLSIRRTNQTASFNGGTVTITDGSSSTAVNVNATGGGAGACPTPGAGFAASTTTVTLTDCTGSSQVTLSGGSGNYTASSQSGSVQATVNGSVLSIRRVSPSAALSGPVTVLASDGSSSIPITVNSSGTGAGSCPDTTTQPVTANPPNVTLSSCTSSPGVVLSGGTGTYSASASNTGIQLTQNGTILTINRRANSPAITAGTNCSGQNVADPGTQCVTVSSGSSSTTVPVTLAPAAYGPC